jgi:hypothetical protein
MEEFPSLYAVFPAIVLRELVSNEKEHSVLRSISPAAYAVLCACCGETDLNKLQDALASPQYALILALMPGMDPSVRAHAAQKANALLFELLAGALRGIPPDDAELIIQALPQEPPDRLKFAVIFTGLEDLFVDGGQSFANVAQNAATANLCRLLHKLHQLSVVANYTTMRSTLEDMVLVLGNSDSKYVWQKLNPGVRKRIIPDINSLATKLAANDQADELSKILKRIEEGMPQLEAYDCLCALDELTKPNGNQNGAAINDQVICLIYPFLRDDVREIKLHQGLI